MKLRWIILFAFILSACIPAPPNDAGPADISETERPATEPPSTDELPIQTQAPATEEPETQEPIEIVCPTLLTPENGLVLPYSADILTFTFTPVEGAEIYLLNIETPVDKLITFQVEHTLVERNLSTFTMPGKNQWYVEVINENREVLCTSETFTFIAEELACATLLTPTNGTELPAVGKVTFSWEPVAGAETYILRFTLPNDSIVEIETDQTTKDRYMEAFGMSGAFEWNVIAFDVNDNQTCASESALFTKPDAQKKKGSSESSDECRLGIDWGCEAEGGTD